MRRPSRLAAALVAGLLTASLAACGDDDDAVTTDDPSATEAPATDPDVEPQPGYTNPQLAAEVLERDPPQPEGTDDDVASDALEVSTLIEGEGDGIQPGDIAVVHYAGVLADGTPFDDSWSRGDPLEVQVGAGMVIRGWDDGLLDARIGERRRLVIGYDLAYGPEGRGPIPPEATLIFEVDVVDIVTDPGAEADG